MAKANASAGQRYELLSVLANNVDWDSLDSGVVQGQIDTPEETGAKFTAFLKNGGRMTVVPQAPLPVWMTVKTRGFKNVAAAREAIKEANGRVGTYPDQMLDRVVFSGESKDLRLVRLSVKEIGERAGRDFSKNTKHEDVISAVKSIGGLVPAEAAPDIRIACKDQPMNDWFVLAMESVPDADGYPHVFRVERHEDGQWLCSDWADPESVWAPAVQFVFVALK